MKNIHNGGFVLRKKMHMAFGTRTILNIDELEIRDGARIGLVGDNGMEKET